MIGSGKSPTNLELMSLNDGLLIDIAIHAVDSEVKRGMKSN